MNEAYERGAQARLSGEPEPVCPYREGTRAYQSFALGFCEAKPLTVPGQYGTRQERTSHNGKS